ncbi:MAG: signal peptidase I [Oscillospiraceae bacterium]|jgi:signal peptidase|nr:signal peptidase I [Oscillospiraceae bacterium]
MALKTLDELNQAFMANIAPKERKPKLDSLATPLAEKETPKTTKLPGIERQEKKVVAASDGQPGKDHPKRSRRLLSIISEILSSLAICLIMLVILTSGSNGGAPRMFLNYLFYSVLTPSMQDEIPQGSFIIVKQIDTQELKMGDNITFLSDRDATVTHKIVDIYDNYNNSNSKGFQTQGVNNANPDRNIVTEDKVIGKVVFVIPVLGTILSNLGGNVVTICLLIAMCILMFFLIRKQFAKRAKRGKGAEVQV